LETGSRLKRISGFSTQAPQHSMSTLRGGNRIDEDEEEPSKLIVKRKETDSCIMQHFVSVLENELEGMRVFIGAE